MPTQPLGNPVFSETTSGLSLLEESNRLVRRVEDLMQRVETEEDLRIGVEKILEPILREIGLEPTPAYEHFGSGMKTIYRGRPDAVHGQVIIEYENPRSFASPAAVAHAHD